ncbi:hypothetical protein G6F46_002236 [Rhizopus delemar]|uniref:Uncharacterized protein n=3 Tax=Rhizopus TaxID=4842 RepID=I1CQK8_RHIO9|nr:hypothetical protein RO3G_15449 [Rhizopus delemar RA 99-880]KAG1463573.1 hypothetical protein G6F55_002312 [Rhizopus delemar]KAG1548245.1 hypothetical protein G6F51_003783 [Rhizopus arrhizus]KAG1501646.1 hypothetical protein G6F54_002894 [Rhizopus delemar]KAG1509970.1 hypothetical protein G6F53_007040 [Rhizopus delemar]|eukprot:EIE90738.1 hypothetical protein RO3G_15449 [Rhizopus delemar RA 99-880]
MDRIHKRSLSKSQHLPNVRKKPKTQEVHKEVPDDNVDSPNVQPSAKLDLPVEKVIESEETTKLKNSSGHLVKYFTDLSEKMKMLADEAETASKSMRNWEYVFSTMKSVNMQNEKILPLVKFDLDNQSTS